MHKITLNSSKIVQQHMLSIKSHRLVFDKLWTTSVMVWKKFSESIEIPKRPFIWLLAIINAAADENPAVTGTETNSTNEPV